jgi:hypothetical protein
MKKLRKSFRIQSTTLLILQKATKTMIIIEFKYNFFFLRRKLIQSRNDKSLCNTREKNNHIDEKYEFIQTIEKNARYLKCYFNIIIIINSYSCNIVLRRFMRKILYVLQKKKFSKERKTFFT